MDLNPERIVATNARRLREELGYSQEHVAQLMTEAGYGTGAMPVWALERGKRRIKVADLFGLSAALGVTPESLLSEGAGRAASAEPARPAGSKYEVTIAGGGTAVFTADSARVDDDSFLNCYLGDARVFFAPVAAVLCCQITEGEER